MAKLDHDAKTAPALPSYSLSKLNQEFGDSSPLEIFCWAIENAVAPFFSTSFGRQSAVMLDLLHKAQIETSQQIPLVWLDSGYATDDTLNHVSNLSKRYQFEVIRRQPEMTPEQVYEKWGGIPNSITHPDEFQEFVRAVKLDPFDKVIDELQPDAWITGIRRTETETRRTMNVFTQARDTVVRVAPIFFMNDDQVMNFVKDNELPLYFNYFDPTKTSEKEECGLHN